MAQNRVMVLDFNHQPLMPCHPARARQLLSQEYRKTHWLDAVCAGVSGENVLVEAEQEVLEIKAMGRGSRQMCRMDQYGFAKRETPKGRLPRTSPKTRKKKVHDFQTGDMVKAVVAKGKKAGCYVGRVAVRSLGSFNIKT